MGEAKRRQQAGLYPDVTVRKRREGRTPDATAEQVLARGRANPRVVKPVRPDAQ